MNIVEPQSNIPYIIGGIVVAFLLLAIIFVIVLCSCMRYCHHLYNGVVYNALSTNTYLCTETVVK